MLVESYTSEVLKVFKKDDILNFYVQNPKIIVLHKDTLSLSR